MRPYPLALRERVVGYYQDTPDATFLSTAEIFKVGFATVNRWVSRHRRHGDLTPKVGHGRPSKVCASWLKTHSESYPDATLLERAFDYQREQGIVVCESTMWHAMARLGVSHKKKHL